jgi:hypothetical protein
MIATWMPVAWKQPSQKKENQHGIEGDRRDSWHGQSRTTETSALHADSAVGKLGRSSPYMQQIIQLGFCPKDVMGYTRI